MKYAMLPIIVLLVLCACGDSTASWEPTRCLVAVLLLAIGQIVGASSKTEEEEVG